MLEWLLLHTIAVTLLAGLAWALARSGRLSPAAQHLVWLLVLVKLLTPPMLFWPWALPDPWRASPDLVEQPAVAAAAHERREDEVILPLPPDDVVALPVEQIQVQMPAGTSPPADLTESISQPFEWQEMLGWMAASCWLGGGLIVATVHGVRIVRLRCRLRGGHAASPELQQQLFKVAAALGVRPPLIQVLADLPSPMLCGWGRPRLLWPQGLETKLEVSGQQAVLVHELAHLRRRDHWTMWLLLAAGCVWWWHPLFWLVRREIGRAAELACDAWVVGTLPQGRRAYAEALLEVAMRGSWTATAAPVLGAAGSRRDFERRLTLVMRETPTCRLSLAAVVAAVALAVVALPGWTLSSLGQAPQYGREPAAKPQPSPLPAVAVPAVEPPVPLPTAVPKTGDAAARETKIGDLEEQIKLLAKQLQDLRGTTKPPMAATPAMPANPSYYYRPVTVYDQGKSVTTYEAVRLDQPRAENEVTLTRVVYKLPADKAEALASFLKQHVKVLVLETKVDGDSMTITTTPDMQRTIGQFVALMRGKEPAKAAK
jgi:beta-lactamase regulating signal transducer with metallopeptidase domain